MLHIILTILKIIGWIILVILGLLVLLICIVFFVPLCYKAEGKGEGPLDTLWGRLKFSWLLHLVSGQAEYKNGKFYWNIRIAWKKLSSEMEPAEETFHGKDFPTENTLPVAPPISEPPLHGDEEAPQKDIQYEQEEPKRNAPEPTLESESSKKSESKSEKRYKKIQEIFQKIKYTFRKICGTIKSLVEKKERLAAFLEDEVHRSAFASAIKELKRLLRLLAPRKWNISVHFGFEDPSITGYVLAFISMIYPYIGEHTDIRPDFEEQVFEGDVSISGKIRVFYMIIVAWNLFWNKNVRSTYKHIRDFKL